MEQGTDKGSIRDLVFVTLIGILFSRFSLGSMLMTVPLLLVVPRVRKEGLVWLSYALVFLGSVGWTLLDSKDLLTTQYIGMVAVSLYMPVCTIVGSAVWTAAGKKSRVGLRKYFLACIPVCLMGLAVAVWFSTDYAGSIKELMKGSMMYMFPEESLGFSIEPVVDTVVSLMTLMFVPMGMVAAGLPVLVSELILYRNDEAWQYDFAFMKLPDVFVWAFLGSWALALGFNFIQVPVWVRSVCWNLAFGLGLLYAIQGISILVALFRRRTAAVSAGRVVVLVLCLCMMPGLNLACLVGLPILGVLETWIRFR